MSKSALRERLHSDDGFSLPELLVTVILISVLGTLVTFALISSNEQFRLADDEATGLADTKTVVERLGRDIRASRGVDAGATASTLSLWIDYNSDYVRNASSQPDEIITWSLLSQGAGSTQFNTIRSTAGGVSQTQSRTLVSDLAFCYQSAPDAACFGTPLSATDALNTRLITVDLQYDANTAVGAEDRTTSFSERLRNVN